MPCPTPSRARSISRSMVCFSSSGISVTPRARDVGLDHFDIGLDLIHRFFRDELRGRELLPSEEREDTGGDKQDYSYDERRQPRRDSEGDEAEDDGDEEKANAENRDENSRGEERCAAAEFHGRV